MNEVSATVGAITGPILKGRVAFVGVGPGDPGLLTLRASELLRTADIIVHGPEQLPDFVHTLLSPQAQVLDAHAPEKARAVRPEASRAKGVRESASFDFSRVIGGGNQESALVVRLCGEDPGRWSRFGDEVVCARAAGFDVEVVPGVSSVSTVPAYIGVPLNLGDGAAVFAAWGPASASSAIEQGPTGQMPVVFIGSVAEVLDNVDSLLTAGRESSTPVSLTEKSTTVQQRTIVSTLGEARADTGASDLTGPIVAVISDLVHERANVEWFESRPLFAWRVLVPRTKDQAASAVAHLAEYGAIGEVVPTISVEPPRVPQQIRKAVQGLVTGRYRWVAFTSVNAVRAVRERLAEVGLDSRALAGVCVASVGGVTAAALQDWGVQPDLVPSAEQSSRGLVADWPAFDPELDPLDRVFLPRADIATETLVAGLRGLGWDPEDVTAYRTVRAAPPPAPVRKAIKAGDFDAVLFTSSSTVRNLVGIAGKPHPTTVVACIGHATARTAQDLGLTVSVVAPTASTQSLVDALAAHGRQLRQEALAQGSFVTRPSQRRRGRRSS